MSDVHGKEQRTMTTPAARATTLAYVDAVHRRYRDPVQPDGFAPDWDDRPLAHTHHPGATRIALPLPAPAAAPTPAPGGGRTLTTLAEDLRATIGVLARRRQIDWNRDLAEQSAPHTPRWGTGSSSGGGTHPLEVYWAAGPSAPVPPGVYHYACGLHALERLSTLDPAPAVRAALGPDGAADGHDQFLLCTVRPWKNAFKYHNLAYHLATLDLGSFLASWELTSRDRGAGHRPRLWFDEEALGGLLGLDPDEESVHAVLPLDWHTAGADASRPAPTAPPAVRPPHYERSRTVRRFSLADNVRRATAQAPPAEPAPVPAPAPAPDVPPAVAGTTTPLPVAPGAPAPGTALATLAARTSSSGRIDASRPLGAAALAAVLGAAFPHPPRSGGFVEAAVAVRAAEGLAPGGYAYDPARHALSHLPGDPLPTLTRDLYGLDNYDVAGVPVTLVLHWHPERAVARHGPRAYRAANAEAGAAAQRAHLAATALGLSSGIVFGIDPVPLDEALGLTAAGRRSQLCVFLGLPRPGAAALDGRLA
ncbi:nitroreductase family protein [Streptomyces sp. NPDC090054]|uniref:nitroreductase family protein n=1 Tax=Streptomyces sp. NPDC090054 TaxID=3365933 RepID=UPI003823FF4D